MKPRKIYTKESEWSCARTDLPMLWPVRQSGAAFEPKVVVLTNLKHHLTSFQVVVVASTFLVFSTHLKNDHIRFYGGTTTICNFALVHPLFGRISRELIFLYSEHNNTIQRKWCLLVFITKSFNFKRYRLDCKSWRIMLFSLKIWQL